MIERPMHGQSARWLVNGLVAAALSVAHGPSVTIATFQATQGTFAPARRLNGAIPERPSPHTVGWVHEMVEVTVGATGRAESVRSLLDTPGTPLVAPAVRGWVFRPARLGPTAEAARVLVAGIFRPPILLQGPALGSPPAPTGVPSRQVPMPVAPVNPDYPPRARGDGVAVVEVLVGRDGRVESAAVIHSAGGFDAAALDAARQWTFRPAEREGVAVPAYAYLVFGFREPVVG
jgi:TonB family protein